MNVRHHFGQTARKRQLPSRRPGSPRPAARPRRHAAEAPRMEGSGQRKVRLAHDGLLVEGRQGARAADTFDALRVDAGDTFLGLGGFVDAAAAFGTGDPTGEGLTKHPDSSSSRSAADANIVGVARAGTGTFFPSDRIDHHGKDPVTG